METGSATAAGRIAGQQSTRSPTGPNAGEFRATTPTLGERFTGNVANRLKVGMAKLSEANQRRLAAKYERKAAEARGAADGAAGHADKLRAERKPVFRPGG